MTKKIDPGALANLLALEDQITQVSRRLAHLENDKIQILRDYRNLTGTLDEAYAKISVDLGLSEGAIFKIDTQTGDVVVESETSAET
jgi:formylmethanofuran dehydrogenase subunit D